MFLKSCAQPGRLLRDRSIFRRTMHLKGFVCISHVTPEPPSSQVLITTRFLVCFCEILGRMIRFWCCWGLPSGTFEGFLVSVVQGLTHLADIWMFGGLRPFREWWYFFCFTTEIKWTKKTLRVHGLCNKVDFFNNHLIIKYIHIISNAKT